MYTLDLIGSGDMLTVTDMLPPGVSAPGHFELLGTSVTPDYDGEQHRLTWVDTPPLGQQVYLTYTVAIFTSQSQALINAAEMRDPAGELARATATIIANPRLVFLPLILTGD